MRWIRRLSSSFGAPFLILITSIYWTQGFRSLPWMGISYQLKDELKLSPAASQFVITVAFMPWSVKPLYGILSDCIPIRGSRRISYLMISSILSFAPWLLLGLSQPMRASYVYLTGLLTAQNLGAAMADVVIDAMIAEAARKERAEYAGDLQSMSWAAMALGGMVGSVAGGFALSTFNAEGVFLLFSIFPLLQFAACGLIDEKALTGGATEEDNGDVEKEEGEEEAEKTQTVTKRIEDLKVSTKDKLIGDDKKELGEDEDQGETASTRGSTEEDEDWVEIQASKIEEITEDGDNGMDKASTEAELSTPEGIEHSEQLDLLHQDGLRRRKGMSETDHERTEIREELENKELQESFVYKIRVTFGSLFQAIKQPAILRPMLWFFLAQITIPSLSTIMFYYQTDFLHLDASFLGTSRLVGWGALMLGTFLYNQYLKHVRLRKIFWWTHIALALITLSDIILVTRLNLWLGIPNKAFVMGASALGDAVNQFKFLPFLVLSGRLCQPGIEGTLFALFMSLSNLGTTLSSFLGAVLASALHISSDKFDNFGLGICIQAVCTIIPIFFLFLIPVEVTGVSNDSSE